MNKLLAFLLIICVISGVPARNQGVGFAASFPDAGSRAADLLEVVPAESVFCLRIDNFEYTIRAMDQFLAGISPVPMALSMAARMQFTAVLGNPELSGVDMNGTFGVFALLGPPGSDPQSSMFLAVLVPVTDYNVFISGNPNVGQPDNQGVSQITSQAVPPMAVKQAGNFALVSLPLYYDQVVATANSMLSGRVRPLASKVGVTDRGAPAAPVWVYVDVQKALKAFGPMVSAQANMMTGAMQPTGPGQADFGELGQAGPPAAIPDMDFEELAKNVQAQFITLGLDPKPTVLNITVTVSALPGTEMAKTFVRGSTELQGLFDQIGAKTPSQMEAELSAISTLIPGAANADSVGTFDLMNLFELAAAFSPIPLPEVDVETKSNVAYAVKVDAGKMAVDIALPKEHVSEIVAALRTREQPVAMDDVPPVRPADEGDVGVPDIRVDTSFGGAFEEGTTSVRQRGAPDEAVKVAGVRLVRYSSLELGVLPLGHGDGYTLALIAELPGPAVKVTGGEIEKAVTDTGKSLLPKERWDRKIKFARLSKDNTTAIFDVELILPDEDATGIEELSGTLQYLTASGARDMDLGVMDFEVGARGRQFGASISSIEADPYRNNATVLGLTVGLPPESVKSVEFYAQDGTKLEISRRGYISVGRATTLKFSIRDQLPARGRMVLSVFEQLQQNELAFKITEVSLTGQPMW